MIRQETSVQIIRVPLLDGDDYAHKCNAEHFQQRYVEILTRKYRANSWQEEHALKQGGLLIDLQTVCCKMLTYSKVFDLAWTIPDADADAARVIAHYFDPTRQDKLTKSRARAAKIRERKAMVEMLQGKRAMGDMRPRKNVFGERMVLTKYGWVVDEAA